MKKTILVLTFVSLMLMTACNQTLQINIVIPSFLAPYYEWFINFPHMQIPFPGEPAPTEMWKEHHAFVNSNHYI